MKLDAYVGQASHSPLSMPQTAGDHCSVHLSADIGRVCCPDYQQAKHKRRLGNLVFSKTSKNTQIPLFLNFHLTFINHVQLKTKSIRKKVLLGMCSQINYQIFQHFHCCLQLFILTKFFNLEHEGNELKKTLCLDNRRSNLYFAQFCIKIRQITNY